MPMKLVVGVLAAVVLANGELRAERYQGLQLTGVLDMTGQQACRLDDSNLFVVFEALVHVSNTGQEDAVVLPGREVAAAAYFGRTREDLLSDGQATGFGRHDYVAVADPLDPAGTIPRLVPPGAGYTARVHPFAVVRTQAEEGTAAKAIGRGRYFVRLVVDVVVAGARAEAGARGNVERGRWQPVVTDIVEVFVDTPATAPAC